MKQVRSLQSATTDSTILILDPKTVKQKQTFEIFNVNWQALKLATESKIIFKH